MELGTLKTNIKVKPKLKKRPTLSGFGGKSGGNNGGGNNGGGDDSNDSLTQSYEKSFSIPQILTVFLLVIVFMTFSGVIGAYIFSATNDVLEWKPFNLPPQVFLSTALILISSFTYAVAQRAIKANNHQKLKTWLIATTVLGAMFISSQILVWMALVNRGYYLQSNPYAGFFYFMTVLHAVHVFGGIIALGYIVLRVWNQTDVESELEKRREISSSVGWYWHFMGGLWVVLLLLLGFWK